MGGPPGLPGATAAQPGPRNTPDQAGRVIEADSRCRSASARRWLARSRHRIDSGPRSFGLPQDACRPPPSPAPVPITVYAVEWPGAPLKKNRNAPSCWSGAQLLAGCITGITQHTAHVAVPGCGYCPATPSVGVACIVFGVGFHAISAKNGLPQLQMLTRGSISTLLVLPQSGQLPM